MKKIILSDLPHTWFIDLDGTILKHNGYKLDGYDSFLTGAKSFLASIPKGDFIIFVTSRPRKIAKKTLNFLIENKIYCNHIIFNLPFGERILINDKKLSGLNTAHSINLKRNNLEKIIIKIDYNL
jgi:hypothetical protein